MEIDKELERELMLAPLLANNNERQPEIVLFITSDAIGHENAALGKKLMHSFLYSLTEMQPRVRTIILINSGIRLVCKGATTVEPLHLLFENKVGIILCEESVHHYGKMSDVLFGRNVNMYTITNIILSAPYVITL